MLQQLNVVGESCESTLVLKRIGEYFEHTRKLRHFNLSVTQQYSC